jgi:hypothetical protein
MKKFLLIAGLASFAALGGCSSTGTLTANVAAIEAEVQADANLVCGFIPTVATIASFIPGGSVVAPAAASIAESICGAVAAAPPVTVSSARLRSLKKGGRLGAAVNVATVIVPGVGPVPISGQFTR